MSSKSKPSNTDIQDRIAPGKKTLFYGSAPVGSTITVQNTELYDLFAVRFQTTAVEKTVMLAYKIEDMVRGIGGWVGDTKNLRFFAASISGNTWKILGTAGSFISDGAMQDTVPMRVTEIIGII